MSKRLASNIINLFLVVLGVTLFVMSQNIQTGAALAQGGDFMPKLCTGIWCVLSIALLISGFWEPVAEEGAPTKVKSFVATLALLAAYVYLLKPAGFVVGSVLYIFVQIMLFAPRECRTKKHLLLYGVIAVVMPVAVNWLFANAFALILPQGMLFR